MAGDSLYLLTFLPALGEPGWPPPISLSGMLERVLDCGGNPDVVEAILLSDDLVQYHAYSSGEVSEVESTVLAPEQTRGGSPLPEYLAEQLEGKDEELGRDAVWEAYYRYVAEIASAQKSEFLTQWVKFEIGLRNALAIHRAKSLDLDPTEYVVVPDLGGAERDFSGVVSEWTAAQDPLHGLRVLDTARWAWLTEHDKWFTFEDDELAVYAAKLMLLHRRHRLSEQSH